MFYSKSSLEGDFLVVLLQIYDGKVMTEKKKIISKRGGKNPCTEMDFCFSCCIFHMTLSFKSIQIYVKQGENRLSQRLFAKSSSAMSNISQIKEAPSSATTLEVAFPKINSHNGFSQQQL